MRKSFIGAAVAALVLANPANAAVVLGDLTGGSAQANGGVFQLITPAAGFQVGNDNQQSNDLFAFDEQQGVALGAAIGGLAAGTVVNSHYVFFDPGPSRTAIGYVDFDGDILAVLDTRSDMDATDGSLGNPNVNYISVNLRGLEGGDSFNVVGNRLNIDWSARRPGDYIRVLTGPAVPEPATWAMLIFGFGAIGAAMRRRKVKTTFSYA